jgi:thymidylate synthase
VSNYKDPRQDTQPAESHSILTDTIGEAWIAISSRIMDLGSNGLYDQLAMREILMATLTISGPQSEDAIIQRHADGGRLSWMHENFADHQVVEALGNADSYATRLRDYAHTGRDQIEWVIGRLRTDPSTRSATITTFQPLTDTSYIPCVSLLDFFLVNERLDLVVYAHSIDFGAKGYANLVELASLQEEVAESVGCALGTLTMIVKSAHVYATDFSYMNGVLNP